MLNRRSKAAKYLSAMSKILHRLPASAAHLIINMQAGKNRAQGDTKRVILSIVDSLNR
jgi:hypothetical protein